MAGAALTVADSAFDGNTVVNGDKGGAACFGEFTNAAASPAVITSGNSAWFQNTTFSNNWVDLSKAAGQVRVRWDEGMKAYRRFTSHSPSPSSSEPIPRPRVERSSTTRLMGSHSLDAPSAITR